MRSETPARSPFRAATATPAARGLVPAASVALLPDSPASLLLTELASYAADLSEAAEAMELALAEAEDSPLWTPLTSYATVAYMRCFAFSTVRNGLGALITLDEGLAQIHKTLQGYRNTTVAHSQSRLSMPTAVAFLDEHGRVDRVFGATLRHQLPRRTAEDFSRLIHEVSNRVAERAAALHVSLKKEHSAASPEEIAGWRTPEITHELDAGFTAASKRRRHPKFTMYWRAEDDIDKAVAAVDH